MGPCVGFCGRSALSSLFPSSAAFCFWQMILMSLCLPLSPTSFSCPLRLSVASDRHCCRQGGAPGSPVMMTACSIEGLCSSRWDTGSERHSTYPSHPQNFNLNGTVLYHRRGISSKETSFEKSEKNFYQLSPIWRYNFICCFHLLLKCFRLLIFGK